MPVAAQYVGSPADKLPLVAMEGLSCLHFDISMQDAASRDQGAGFVDWSPVRLTTMLRITSYSRTLELSLLPSAPPTFLPGQQVET